MVLTVDVKLTGSRHNLVECGLHCHGSTLPNVHGTRVIRPRATRVKNSLNVVIGDITTVDGLVFAVAKSIFNLATQPTNGLTCTILVEFRIIRVNVEIHVIGKIGIHLFPFASSLIKAQQYPVNGHFSLGIKTARIAEMQFVHLLFSWHNV